MNIAPSKSEFIEYAKQGNLVPVYADLMADFETPVSVYAKLSRSGPAFLFESVEGGTNLNRYSFIGCRPRRIIKSYWDRTEVTERGADSSTRSAPEDPLRIIEREMASFKPVRMEGMPRFIGGAVGFLGYEYIHAVEPSVPVAAQDPVGTPVAYFMITDMTVIFDRVHQTIRLLVNAHIQDDPEKAYAEAVADVESLFKMLREEHSLLAAPVIDPGEVVAPPGNFSRAEFEALVERSKAYIHAGDVIQVVLSQRFERDYRQSPLDLYRALRTVNPSPYMFIFDTGEYALVGASPEVHVRLTDGLAQMRPIAGTRPRGNNEEEDGLLEKDLLSDEKECAEHLMLLDLGRNDVGKVAKIGSVNPNEKFIIERYSHVMHIVSNVVGELSDDEDALSALLAGLPAGTVSGAPKVRAMEIIDELETEKRGIYGGGVGYFSAQGDMDICIALRTAVTKDEKLYIQAGGGVVFDSDPEAEYQESINKSKALTQAAKDAGLFVKFEGQS